MGGDGVEVDAEGVGEAASGVEGDERRFASAFDGFEEVPVQAGLVGEVAAGKAELESSLGDQAAVHRSSSRSPRDSSRVTV